MIRLTLIARASDGLILAGSFICRFDAISLFLSTHKKFSLKLPFLGRDDVTFTTSHHVLYIGYYAEEGREIKEYTSMAKDLFKKLNENSPNRRSLEAGLWNYQYVYTDIIIVYMHLY